MRPSVGWLALFLLLGCANNGSILAPPDVPVAVPVAQPLTLNPVQWQVTSRPSQAGTPPQKVFSLDGANYNNLALNLIELERYIKEQGTILAMLKTIIAGHSNRPAASR